ncbi:MULTISPECIES: LysR family transcriptional regulator [Marinobacter]|uniref:LysR family transcriptional regulator n=1 Tax=Marinobacter albus TaxID=3030833 RepID=A0ABT7HFJ6_9GAMM|nr:MULTISPECIES: LysR family transcriptional regulator [Marinobacter]MBW0148428.1 LysR family transcriptional regulator [Marinobacter arenosus]MBW7472097.1 LysR family transcriptional regulator [Marinobacter sp. F4218]MDK9558667.1 LysR family transcriptional regulator [Marinobacter sp. M216]
MELRHLRYFVAVGEEGNLTRAAEKLFIAQPPLTRAMKQLEEEIGVELFVRKPRGLELTNGGEYFLEQARQILDKVTATVEDTRRIAQHRKTIFSIGFVPSVFYGQLPLMVRRLRRNKNLEIVLHELKTREQVEALKTGKIDIGFGRISIEDPDVEQELLFDEPIIAAIPAGHQLTRHPPSMKELSAWPMVTFPAGPGPNFADITQGLFHRRGLKIHVSQQVNDLQTALSLVASDMGFTLVPEQVRKLNREGVEFMPLEDNNITTPVIASRRRGENPNAVMRLANTILAELVENRLTGRYP